MSKLLYIQASPRGERSHSTTVAEAFLDTYAKEHPGDEIRVFNVFDEDLPPFDGHSVQAKYNLIHGKEHTPEDKAAWDRVVALIEEFKSYDKYLLSVPMWNWSIPYRLKQYLDILLQPGFAFKYNDSGGLDGLMGGKAYVIYARGGQYPKGSPAAGWDHQSPYLEFILRDIMGIQIVDTMAVEATLGDPGALAEHEAAAVAKAKEVAKSF